MNYFNKKVIQPGRTKTLKGSVLLPENAGLRLVVNLCSSEGVWETPLNLQISKKWARAKEDFKNLVVNRVGYKPGNIQTSLVQSDIWIVNMFCLDAKGKVDGKAFEKCLGEVLKVCQDNTGSSVHVSELEKSYHEKALEEVYGNYFNTHGFNVICYFTE